MGKGDILRMLFERGNAMQSFWGFYITISLGLIAFFGSAPRSKPLAILMSAAFIAFAVVNCDGMTDIARQRKTLFTSFQSTASTENGSASVPLLKEIEADIAKASKPPEPIGVATFHIVADVGVLAAIWFLTLKP